MGLRSKARERKKKKKQDRRDFKLQKMGVRQDAKTERTNMRQQTKQIAYENGMDPNAFIGDAIEQAGNVASSYFNSKNPQGGLPPADGKSMDGNDFKRDIMPQDNKKTIFVVIGIAIAGLLAFFMLKGKK
jgi:hypothetical protein